MTLMARLRLKADRSLLRFSGVFDAYVLDGLLDGFLGQHRAVQLHRRQLQVAGDVGVLYLQGILHLHPLYHLGRVRTRSDG